jgi:hypothetical protein
MPADTKVDTAENLRQFGLWMEGVLQRPGSWEMMRRLIALEDPEDLSKVVKVVRNAELTCTLELQKLIRQTRLERQDTRGQESRIGLIVYAEESAYWNGRIRWLQASRACLEKQQPRYSTP